jgi:uncharacterized protein DUF1572
MSVSIIDSIRAESLRYKALGEAAMDQLDEAELSVEGPNGGNSVATIGWHLAGNLRSRFTDFLVSDGEKPWRQREEEFQRRTVTRAELLAKWEEGWSALLRTLASLRDEQLQSTITIRRQPMLVHEALHRSLAHLAYHVGQIVYIAKSLRGRNWQYLSIPPGESDAYHRNPTFERAAAHATRLAEKRQQE